MTLVLITGMAALSVSIFLPSLAAMTTYFGTEYAVMQVALSGYLAATALLQVFIGPISDRYGRRILVLGSLGLFVLASLGAMMSTSVEVFLFFRILQAAVATSMALGRAIVRDPQVFLFDEPLSNLDAKLRVQMRAEIRELQQRLAATTVYVTHDQIEAMTMGHRVAVMRLGVLQQVAPPQELYLVSVQY